MKTSSKIFFILAITLTISIFSGISLYRVPIKEKNPKIVFEKLTNDFGKVLQGTVLEYSFKFTNEGSGKLIITNVQASCGCTGAVIDGKKEFEENETGEVKVTFNTQGREGIQSKTVNVSSNDSTQSNIVLSFKCEIVKE